MVGLGGIWIEALGHIRLLPPGISQPRIVEQLHKLRSARLLAGFRGSPGVDVEEVARTVSLIGRLMVERPDILEVDVNPLIALAAGKGAIALDALVVTK